MATKSTEEAATMTVCQRSSPHRIVVDLAESQDEKKMCRFYAVIPKLMWSFGDLVKTYGFAVYLHPSRPSHYVPD